MPGRQGVSPAVAWKGGAVAAGTKMVALRLKVKRGTGGLAADEDAMVLIEAS